MTWNFRRSFLEKKTNQGEYKVSISESPYMLHRGSKHHRPEIPYIYDTQTFVEFLETFHSPGH